MNLLLVILKYILVIAINGTLLWGYLKLYGVRKSEIPYLGILAISTIVFGSFGILSGYCFIGLFLFLYWYLDRDWTGIIAIIVVLSFIQFMIFDFFTYSPYLRF